MQRNYQLLTPTKMEINAKDLRIGNLVTLADKQRKELWENQINATNKYFEVKTIYSDGDIALELDEEIVDIDLIEVQPIPITEQLLLEFGFHKDNFVYRKNDFVISGWFTYNGNLELKYVHQLQNLYFALTNQELIKQ